MFLIYTCKRKKIYKNKQTNQQTNKKKHAACVFEMIAVNKFTSFVEKKNNDNCLCIKIYGTNYNSEFMPPRPIKDSMLSFFSFVRSKNLSKDKTDISQLR